LLWYYGEGIAGFYHSSTGNILDRCQLFASGDSVAIPVHDGWRYMHVPKEDRIPVTTFDPVKLERFGRISRRMLAVERLDSHVARCFELYFGDEGARWARQPPPSRLISIYTATHSGATYLRNTPTVEGIRDTERLANVEVLCRLKATPQRRGLVKRLRTESAELLVRMWRAWDASKTD
jgi:hypothetical protein